MSSWSAIGVDPSPTHCGVVVLNSNGKLIEYSYICGTKAEAAVPAKDNRGFATRFPPDLTSSKIKCSDTRTSLRLIWSQSYYKNLFSRVLSISSESFVGIEDYAYAAAHGAHQTGEIGAVVRLAAIMDIRSSVRFHDPLSIKMFASGKGNASKTDVIDGAHRKWNVQFKEFKQLRDRTIEDLTDAYVIARMVWLEVKLRRGEITMNSLDEHEIRVFNRATNKRPVNILARDWITWRPIAGGDHDTK